MIHIDTSGIDAFVAQLNLEMARFDREISEHFYRYTVELFQDIVWQSPQWSGDMASNWNYSVHQPNFTYVKSENKAAGEVNKKRMAVGKIVYRRGMDPAVETAMSRMRNVPRPTWRDTVYFANATPIAPYVEAHSIHIRPVNLIGGQVAMIAYTLNREAHSGRIV